MADSSLTNPGEVFERCAENGSNFLERLRAQITAPEQRKRMRRWGIQEAARLIGRSPQSIRQLEATGEAWLAQLGDVDKDASGRRSYTLERINRYREHFGTRSRRPPGSSAIRCAVTNFKGGAGKTTTAVHLAQKCALEGLRVLAIDLDPQASFTLLFGMIPDLDVERDQTIGDVLVSNPAMLGEVIQPTYFTGVDLVPANLALQDCEMLLGNPNANEARAIGLSPVERLNEAIRSVEDQYDVIIIDCGPNLGILTLNAVYAASGLLIPMPPAMADFGSAVMFFQTMSILLSNPRFSKTLDFLNILITRHTGSVEAKQTEAMIRLAFSPYVLDSVMVQTVEIERAGNDFGTVYDIEQPRGSAEAYLRAYRSLEEANDGVLQVFRQVWAEQAIRTAA